LKNVKYVIDTIKVNGPMLFWTYGMKIVGNVKKNLLLTFFESHKDLD